jgi:hypothetical protein
LTCEFNSLLHTRILSLGQRVSKDEANLTFHNATQKVIKDAFNYAYCIYVAFYYRQVNLLPFGMHVLNLLIFTLTCKCNSFLHASVEAIDEAHLGPWDLSDQGAAPLGAIDWLVKDLKAWDWFCGY